jgi:putative flavoprotein involved in K+ transport
MGVVVAGRLTGFTERRALFAASLDDDVRDADRRMRRVLARIDAHIDRSGSDAPPADRLPLVELGLGPAIVGLGSEVDTIVWATGYRRAYPWLDVPVLGPDGELVHDEGVTAVPGLFALGLRFQRTRRSHFLGGVGADAIGLAEVILAREDEAGLRRAA